MASRTPSSSGADRYASFDFMRAARKPAQEDPGSRYKAWESMRPSARAQPTASATSAKTPGTSGASANPAPTKPKPPPRTAFQRQKADASFGARKSGFAPKSPGGDEPSVPSSNYASSTRMHTNMFNDMSANARRARRASSNAGPADMFRDSFLDPRQSTPYQTRGGEKLNPFDGTNLGRAKSTRESPRGKDGDTNATANSHRRSSSAPGDPDEFPRPAGQRAAPGTSTQSTKTQFGGRPQPRNPGDAAGAPTGTARNASETNANSSSCKDPHHSWAVPWGLSADCLGQLLTVAPPKPPALGMPAQAFRPPSVLLLSYTLHTETAGHSSIQSAARALAT